MVKIATIVPAVFVGNMQDLLCEVRMKASTQGLFGSGYASTGGGF